MQNRTGPWSVPRVFVRAVLVLLPFVCVLLTTARADAYTWMIRHAYNGCGVCHADPSGGEVLTPYGRAQSDLLLRMRYDGKSADQVEPGKASNFLGFLETPPNVMLGGSTRLASTLKGGEYRFFPMQLDLYGQFRFGDFFFGGSVGLSKVPAGSPHARAAQVTTGQGDSYNMISRNHYVGMDFAEQKFTLRAGRLNLPFGVRIPEHTLWVREVTRTDRESDQQDGVALAYNSDIAHAEGMAILGNYQINPDEFRERGYTFFFELLAAERWAFGVSSLYTYAKRDRLSLETNIARGAHGVSTRVAIADPFALLAEMDLLTDSTRDLGYVGFLQGDYEVVQGLHGLLTGEVMDQGYPKNGENLKVEKAAGQGKPQFGTWISAQWFFLPHMDIRVDAIVRSEFTLLTQFHAFL
ncbi:MAG TPA: hypothetical protein VMS65_16725 [Polyangiaceae bacterium]|nr:hypothetical protein [Polyangiaceae bacterium]